MERHRAAVSISPEGYGSKSASCNNQKRKRMTEFVTLLEGSQRGLRITARSKGDYELS